MFKFIENYSYIGKSLISKVKQRSKYSTILSPAESTRNLQQPNIENKIIDDIRNKIKNKE